MHFLLIGFALFVVCTVIAGYQTRRAVAALSLDEKAQLIDATTGRANAGALSLLALAAWFGIVYFSREFFFIATAALLLLILIGFGLSSILQVRRLLALRLPAAFLAAYVRTRRLRLLGAGSFLGAAILLLTGVVSP